MINITTPVVYITINVTNPPVDLTPVLEKLDKIMVTQAQHAQDLADLSAQLTKATDEINASIKALEDALATAGGTTPEVDAAMADLKAKVQILDDMNPDAPPTPTP